LALVVSGLPQFQHQVVSGVMTARTSAEQAQKDNVCHVARIKTPQREARAAFTAQPIIHTLANGVVTTRQRLHLFAPFLNLDGSLRLSGWLSHPRHRLGLSPGRSFGPGIDAVVTQTRSKNPQALVEVEADNHFRSRLLKLMHQDAFQAIVGYPEELAYHAQLLSVPADELVFLAVAEEPPLVAGHVACSKSALGQQVVQAVDGLIAQPAFRKAVQDAYRQWLDPASRLRYDQLVR
jgi:uncharacterized protein (TIGR02285 family)